MEAPCINVQQSVTLQIIRNIACCNHLLSPLQTQISLIESLHSFHDVGCHQGENKFSCIENDLIPTKTDVIKKCMRQVGCDTDPHSPTNDPTRVKYQGLLPCGVLEGTKTRPSLRNCIQTKRCLIVSTKLWQIGHSSVVLVPFLRRLFLTCRKFFASLHKKYGSYYKQGHARYSSIGFYLKQAKVPKWLSTFCFWGCGKLYK